MRVVRRCMQTCMHKSGKLLRASRSSVRKMLLECLRNCMQEHAVKSSSKMHAACMRRNVNLLGASRQVQYRIVLAILAVAAACRLCHCVALLLIGQSAFEADRVPLQLYWDTKQSDGNKINNASAQHDGVQGAASPGEGWTCQVGMGLAHGRRKPTPQGKR